MQVRIDEMQTRIAGLRAMLRENPAAQETYGAQILSLESEMLSAQGLRTQVAARINAIEQAWLTEHPDYVPAAETEKSLITQTPESQQSRNLVFNGYFRENLPARDYEALLRAQRMEAEVAGCAGRLLENYRQQTLLKQQYDTVRTEQAAVDLFGRYRTVANLGRVLRDSLTAVWGYVYDNKSYAYDYILDKLNCREQQARQQKALDDVRRQINDTIQVKPYSSAHKIYIVDEAEKMTVQAQNALLKTIEEPPAYAVILLLTTNAEAFLPTILSRCVQLKLKPLKDGEVKDYLVSRMSVEMSQAEIYTAFARGNLGKAIHLAESEEFRVMYDALILMLKHLKDADISELLEYIRKLKEENLDIRGCLDFMQMWYRDVLMYKTTKDINLLIFKDEFSTIKAMSTVSGYDGLERILQAIEKARVRLDANVNMELVMELMFLTMKEN